MSLFVISLKAITLGRLLCGESSHANSHYTLSRAWSVMDEELCPYEEVHDMLRGEAIWWLFGKSETEVSKAQEESQEAKCLPNSVRSVGRGTQPALQMTEMTRNQNKNIQHFLASLLNIKRPHMPSWVTPMLLVGHHYSNFTLKMLGTEKWRIRDRRLGRGYVSIIL